MGIDITCEESIQDPAAYFARARKEGGDVQWSNAQNGWVVLSHAEVDAAFKEPKTLSADRSHSYARVGEGRSEAFARAAELLTGWMNFRDPPVHTRLREPVRAAFTPRAVSGVEKDVREIVDEAIDALGERADLYHDFARSIPALVIAAILGVDREDRVHFQEWSDGLGELVFSYTPRQTAEEPVARAGTEFIDFFSRHIERERKNPTSSILSAIANDASGLTHMELIGACTLLLFAGHESTTTLLGNAIAMLLNRPEMMDWLRRHPEADESAIEEFMRTVGPARAMVRKVAVDHERGGKQLQARQNVFVSIAAANHDERVFKDPGTVDLLRDPNPHLGFGWGLHFCLGATLARLEARLALRTLLDRFPVIEADGEVPPMHANALGFGRRPLRVRLGR